jgi:anti-sigma factor RsiW
VQCAEQYRVQAYFDGEVDALSAIDIERHAERCPDCRALLEDLARLRTQLRRELPFETAPAPLRARIGRALDEEPGAARAAPRARLRRTRPFWLGSLGSLGAALAAGAAVLLLMPVRPDPLLDELVSAHVRSLMPEHLTDVVSTDRHTVKPWFAGHADVSPVVADFAPEGYRLIGGRADYFERQRAAAVVYQHGAHVINVFAWVAGQGTLPETTARNGYHLAFWRVGDVQYCAVSDAGWDELRGLERLLRDLGARDQMP